MALTAYQQSICSYHWSIYFTDFGFDLPNCKAHSLVHLFNSHQNKGKSLLAMSRVQSSGAKAIVPNFLWFFLPGLQLPRQKITIQGSWMDLWGSHQITQLNWFWPPSWQHAGISPLALGQNELNLLNKPSSAVLSILAEISDFEFENTQGHQIKGMQLDFRLGQWVLFVWLICIYAYKSLFTFVYAYGTWT